MYVAFRTWELAVIDEGNGYNVEVHRGVYCCQREHDNGVGHKSPLDTFASAMDGVKQGGHTSEEQRDEEP